MSHKDGFIRMETKVKRKGTVLVFTAVMMTVLIGFASLAIDVGHMYALKARRQNAADAGALAGAAVMFDEFGLNKSLAVHTVKEYVRKNDFDDVEIDIRIGKFINGQLIETHNVPDVNAIQVTVKRNEILFFAGIFGITDVDIGAVAVVGRSALSSACVVPVALRAPDFGPVDFNITAVNPAKDGPSYPSNDRFFAYNEEVVVFAFGKGPRQPVHLVLDLPQFHGVAETNAILGDKWDRGCGLISVGDKLPVWNNGTGDGNFGVKLLDRMTDDNPDNDTIVVPVVASLFDSHNEDGKLTGHVEIVDFVGVHLEKVIDTQVVDPNGKIIKIKLLIGKVVPVITHGTPADNPGGFSFTVSSLRLLR